MGDELLSELIARIIFALDGAGRGDAGRLIMRKAQLLERDLAAKDKELAEAREALRALCEGLEIEQIDLLISVGKAGDFRALGTKMTERIKAIVEMRGRWGSENR